MAASDAHGNPLAPDAILRLFESVLPNVSPHGLPALANEGKPEGESAAGKSAPWFRGPHDLLAALCHAVMVAVDFRFAGIGDEGPAAPVEKDAREVARLPPTWNSGDSFAFRYTHPLSQMTFLVKGLKFGNRMIIHGQGAEVTTVHSLELNMNEYIAPSARFPYPSQPSDSADAASIRQNLISEKALTDVIARYKVSILQKLIPSLNMPGYEEVTTSTAASGGDDRRRSANLQHDPLRDPRAGGGHGYVGEGVPGFGGLGLPPPIGGGGPFSVGSRDLDPLASMGGYVDPRRFGDFDDGGGMIVGPGHPMFGLGDRGGLGVPEGERGREIFGGPQELPPGSVPPGARFDPIGPFGTPPHGPPGRHPVRPRGPLSGEPDFDELLPPGSAGPFGGRPPGGFGGGGGQIGGGGGFGGGSFGGNSFI